MNLIKIYQKAFLANRDSLRKSVRLVFALTLAFFGFFVLVSADQAYAMGGSDYARITVVLRPQGAIDAGAQYTVTMTDPGPGEHDDNLTASYGPYNDVGSRTIDVTEFYENNDISEATWEVSFRTDVSGWIAPQSPQSFTLGYDDHTVYGIYTEDTTSSSTTTTTVISSTTTTTVPWLGCVDISDTPLDTQLQAAPATIMFVVDDSGSMDFEILTPEDGGSIWDGRDEYFYIFDMSDNEYSYYYELSGSDRNLWRSQWAGYNRMYYNPEAIYLPWPTTSGYYSDASTTHPKSAPWSNTSDTLDLGHDYSSIGTLHIKNAHYYVWSDSESAMYLVNIDRELKYYRFTSFSTEDENHNHYLDPGEDDDDDGLIDYTPTNASYAGLTRDNSPPDDIVPKNGDDSARSYTEELQNFANWFSFYRRRELTSKNAMGNVLVGLQGVQVGIHTIHERIEQPALKVKVTEGDDFFDNTGTLLDLIYGLRSDQGTPLRIGLKTVGEYFAGDGDSPYSTSPYYPAETGGECQQSFTIVMTDGYWNGSSPDVGNWDDGEGYPYEDNYSNTLADVAMKYYETDLSSGLSGLANLVPVNAPDIATYQHMVTYGISFGVYGTLNPDAYDFYDSDNPTPITWPEPEEDEKTTIDDLFHASVNGRGEFLNASDPQDLTSSLQLLMQNIESRVGSGASVSINGEELYAGSVMFQSIYSSDDWTGEVKAYPILPGSGFVDKDNYTWSASLRLQNKDWNSKRIVGTYNGASGVAFRYGSLSETQQGYLVENQVNYLRGETTNEERNNGIYRNRTYLLGDIVHSAPRYHDDVIYAAGNDGMLHAFDASNGDEIFAYVPNLVFTKLPSLTDPEYEHTFFVDQTPYVKDISETQTLLAGGLGAGGRGYYCLDVSSTNITSLKGAGSSFSGETTLAGMVQWEYPCASTPAEQIADLGYSLSNAFIVNSTEGWVVIFGNGYNSTNENAVFFVLDALTGELLTKIDTGVGSCNGLSTPVPVDVNIDEIIDYAYAGDLKGNLWKFDLTGENASDWEVAFMSGDTPMPLFQAKDGSGNVQPITTMPDVVHHCVKNGYMVVFGTGKYLGNTDFSDTNTQTIYGIWDYGDDTDNSEYLGSFERNLSSHLSNQPEEVTLLEQGEIFYDLDPGGSGNYLRVLTANQAQWNTVADDDDGENDNPGSTLDQTTHAGWFFDLDNIYLEGERVIRDVIVRDGKAVVISSIPKSSPCAAGGDSIVHEMDACNGGRLSSPAFDLDGHGTIDDDDMVTIPDPDNPDETITVAPTGIKYNAMIYSPMILRNSPIEIKYFSSADGGIRLLKEEAERLGVFYWKMGEN